VHPSSAHPPISTLTPGSSFTREESSDEESCNKPIRSSSLKTGKTPPNTPGRKKIVRFADALGLDLAAVRTFLDEIPNVPKSAFRDLDYALEAQQLQQLQQLQQKIISKTLLPTFHQPVSRPDFFDRIREQKVLLENAFLSDNFTIRGTVRVKNMDFHKSLYIRYSLDEWATFVDFQATYVPGSCDGFSDKFDFTIHLSPNQVEIGAKLQFAARFHCSGQQFWDNNGGNNYIFHCVPGSGHQQSYGYGVDDPWVHHMWM
jgi:protein phosphatase 1 regulatory subunit 3A/B/C/D/E